MYAGVIPGAMPRGAGDRYVDLVERIAARITRATRWLRELNPWVIDAVLGTVFTIVSVSGLYGNSGSNHVYSEPNAFGIFLALAAGLPFYVRRRYPLGVHVIVITS